MDGTTPVTAPPPNIKSRGLRYPKAPFMTHSIRVALRKDKYETNMLASCIRTALPEDVVVDLGSGLGAVAATLSKRESVRHVHAFEANPTLAEYLPRMMDLNGIENVTVTQASLGKRKASADFHLRKSPTLSSLHDREGSPVEAVEKIDVLNAKTLFKSIAPTLLTVDIEGGEADVIPDLDLSGLRAAVVKLHPKWIGPVGVNAVFSAMMKAGLQYNARGSNGKVVSFRRMWPTA